MSVPDPHVHLSPSYTSGSCVKTTRLRYSSTCQLLCWGWAWSSFSTPGSHPSPTMVCALLLLQHCITSCWPPSHGWALRLCTCTLHWSRSSMSTFLPTCSSSVLSDGVRLLLTVASNVHWFWLAHWVQEWILIGSGQAPGVWVGIIFNLWICDLSIISP